MATESTPAGTGAANSTATTQPNATTTTPTPIDLGDDTLVKLPGSDKPVKWGEHYRGFQSQFTKTSQEKAKLEKAYKEAQDRLQQREQEFERLKALVAGTQAPQEDPYSELKSRQYLDGESAYKLAQMLRGEVGNFGQALSKRDQVLVAMLKQMQQMQQAVETWRAKSSSEEFGSKIKRFLSEHDIEPEFEDLAKEVYLAYEGDDLDQEFPTIFKNRVQQIKAAMANIEKRKREATRQLPFTPAKGGNGVAGKPLSLAGKSSKEVADLLWDQMSGGGEEA